MSLISELVWVSLVVHVGRLEIYAAREGICENEVREEGESLPGGLRRPWRRGRPWVQEGRGSDARGHWLGRRLVYNQGFFR